MGLFDGYNDGQDLASALDMLQSLKQFDFDPYPNLHGAEDTANKLRMMQLLSECETWSDDDEEDLKPALELLELMQKTNMISDDVRDKFEMVKLLFQVRVYGDYNSFNKNNDDYCPEHKEVEPLYQFDSVQSKSNPDDLIDKIKKLQETKAIQVITTNEAGDISKMDILNVLVHGNTSLNVNLFGNNFNISNERNIYNAIRKKYELLSREAQNKFEEHFKSFEDINDVLVSSPFAFVSALDGAFTEIVRDLISLDIYTEDKEAITKAAFQGNYFDNFVSVHDDYKNGFKRAIEDCTESVQILFCEKLENTIHLFDSDTITTPEVSSWVARNGGVLEVLDTHDTLGEIAASFVIDLVSESYGKSQLERLFKRKSLQLELFQSVYESCFNLHYLILDVLRVHSDIHISGVSDEDKRKAQVMFNNFSAIELPPEKRNKFINEIFSLNPYVSDYYKVMIEKFGDSDGDFERFSVYFGIDILDVKNDIIKEFVVENLGEDESEALRCQSDMFKKAEEIGLNVDLLTQGKDIIDEQLEKLDLQYRTFKRIIFETRELADKAKEELPAIEEIIKDIEPPNKNSIISYETDLLEKKQQVDEFTTKIKDSYLAMIDDYIEKFNKLFLKTGVFSKAETKEDAAQEKLLKHMKTLPILSWENYDTAMVEFEKLLPEYGLSVEQATRVTAYFNECNLKLRTISGVAFATREQAEFALSEWVQIEPILKAVHKPNSESLLDYEERLNETQKDLQRFTVSELQQVIDTFFQNKHKEFDK